MACNTFDLQNQSVTALFVIFSWNGIDHIDMGGNKVFMVPLQSYYYQQNVSLLSALALHLKDCC